LRWRKSLISTKMDSICTGGIFLSMPERIWCPDPFFRKREHIRTHSDRCTRGAARGGRCRGKGEGEFRLRRNARRSCGLGAQARQIARELLLGHAFRMGHAPKRRDKIHR
jgi:hypothetical protein